MGKSTDDTFDPIKAFCNVRLQQGVPLVDADVNELDDIRKFEVRAFLKWFVGDGVPYGNDGFRIAPATTAAADDFLISAGTQPSGTLPAQVGPDRTEFSLRGLGRCIVDGLDVIIPTNTTYKTQPLHESQPNAATLASAYGVPVISKMPTPTATGSVLVYLDIWERPVLASEDGSLVVRGVGFESAARRKREWVVRTVAGNPPALPANTTINGAAHHYYGLATINLRVAGTAPQNIVKRDIVDLREQTLLLPPARLIQDVFGADPIAYRQGLVRPLVIDMRTALNALLHGELPGTAEKLVSATTSDDLMSFGFSFDNTGAAIGVWSGTVTVTGASVLWAARCDPATGTITPKQFAPKSKLPHAVTLPTGDLIVAYCWPQPSLEEVFFVRVADMADLASATSPAPGTPLPSGAYAPQMIAPKPIAGTQRHRHPYAVVVPDRGWVVFFWHDNLAPTTTTPGPGWMFRRRQYDATWSEANASWLDDSSGPVLSTTNVPPEVDDPGHFHASVDGTGLIWVAYTTKDSGSIQPVLLVPTALASGQLTMTITIPSPWASPLAPPNNTVDSPFVVGDRTTGVWIFFTAQNTLAAGIYWGRLTMPTAGPLPAAPPPLNQVPGTVGAVHSSAALDASNGLWLAWSAPASAGATLVSAQQIFAARHNLTTGVWGAVRQVTATPKKDGLPFLQFDGSRLWLFWRRIDSSGKGGDIYFRQLAPEI